MFDENVSSIGTTSVARSGSMAAMASGSSGWIVPITSATSIMRARSPGTRSESEQNGMATIVVAMKPASLVEGGEVPRLIGADEHDRFRRDLIEDLGDARRLPVVFTQQRQCRRGHVRGRTTRADRRPQQ